MKVLQRNERISYAPTYSLMIILQSYIGSENMVCYTNFNVEGYIRKSKIFQSLNCH